MPIIKLLQRAEAELNEACKWYETQQKGLSLPFRLEIKKTLDLVGLNPFLYAKRYDTEMHFAPLKKFPFIIIYWYDESTDAVFVTSVFHTKRKPEGHNG